MSKKKIMFLIFLFFLLNVVFAEYDTNRFIMRIYDEEQQIIDEFSSNINDIEIGIVRSWEAWVLRRIEILFQFNDVDTIKLREFTREHWGIRIADLYIDNILIMRGRISIPIDRGDLMIRGDADDEFIKNVLDILVEKGIFSQAEVKMHFKHLDCDEYFGDEYFE